MDTISDTALSTLIDSIKHPDPDGRFHALASKRIDQLLLPQGSLGRLGDIVLRLAQIQRRERPAIPRKTLLVFAADHGVTAEGVSAYSSDVTANVCYSFVAGGGAASVLTRCAGATIRVIDVGVAHDFAQCEGLVHKKVAMGTQNFRYEPAASISQTLAAIQAGVAVVLDAPDTDIIALGEVGIGNTTAAAALFSALANVDPDLVVGTGTGIGPRTRAHKVTVVREALVRHHESIRHPLGALATVGGFEISAMTGAILAAASRGIPVLLDGFITSVAALAAIRLSMPNESWIDQSPTDSSIHPYLFASHRSPERGHPILLDLLRLTPLLDLELRIGEGTGAALTFPIIDAACTLVSEIHTFSEAGLEAPSDSSARL